MNRRSFLQSLAAVVGVLTFSKLGQAEERKRGGGAPVAGGTSGSAAGGDKMVDPASPAAKAVHYTENKSTIKDASLKTERQGVKFDQQFCKGCGFFSNPGKVNGKDAGSCQIFAGQKVNANGWCSSWNKKA
jgi:hypothetical protein